MRKPITYSTEFIENDFRKKLFAKQREMGREWMKRTLLDSTMMQGGVSGYNYGAMHRDTIYPEGESKSGVRVDTGNLIGSIRAKEWSEQFWMEFHVGWDVEALMQNKGLQASRYKTNNQKPYGKVKRRTTPNPRDKSHYLEIAKEGSADIGKVAELNVRKIFKGRGRR